MPNKDIVDHREAMARRQREHRKEKRRKLEADMAEQGIIPNYGVGLVQLDAADRGWVDKAECKNLPLEMFYPGRGEKPYFDACEICQVRVECCDYALRTMESHYDSGVWGGTTPRERRLFRKAKSISKGFRNDWTLDEVAVFIEAAMYRRANTIKTPGRGRPKMTPLEDVA